MNALAGLLFLFAPPSDGSNPIAGFLPILLIFFIFYFILLRPQAKQRKQLEASLMALKKGDEVVTAGGLVGEVLHIKEATKDGQPARTLEDRVTIKSGESRVIVERGRIARVIVKGAEPAAS
ncbi:MAG TPA: preprotein translocase subunit YajC [Gemmatimonadaceae bacterium]|nr:preprotein translocase subunit YajC [Gemmatimonadaceae bacterium]